ncbi:hypothetical protein IP84_14065 [beta proteobacterium AAP99]|nr:hypothetical protein IP84_14065 [beta proteobacterium AAP99]
MSDSTPHNRLKVFAWKGYAGVVVLMVLIDVFLSLFTDDRHWMLTALGGAVSLWLCAPLVGWAWQRLYVPRYVGKLSFMGSVLVGVLIVFAPTSLMSEGSLTMSQAVAIALLTCLLFSPFTYASFLYGWRSPHLSET